jgi:uncharacterized protein YjcR
MRLNALIAKGKKDGADYKEIDLLGRQLERCVRVKKYAETDKEADLNPNIEARNAAPKKKSSRNEFNEGQRARVLDAFRESLFDYQKVWLSALGARFFDVRKRVHRAEEEPTRWCAKVRGRTGEIRAPLWGYGAVCADRWVEGGA